MSVFFIVTQMTAKKCLRLIEIRIRFQAVSSKPDRLKSIHHSAYYSFNIVRLCYCFWNGGNENNNNWHIRINWFSLFFKIRWLFCTVILYSRTRFAQVLYENINVSSTCVTLSEKSLFQQRHENDRCIWSLCVVTSIIQP